jgi:hypothetical protein
MRVDIRHDGIYACKLTDEFAQDFLKKIEGHLVKANKSTTSKADAVYRIDDDLVMGGGLRYPKTFLWKEHTTIAVFLID